MTGKAKTTLGKGFFRIMILVAVSIALTIVTGGVQALARNPGAFGLPLPWITFLDTHYPFCEALPVCPPSTKYDWTAFELDVLFFTVIGYSALLFYSRYYARKNRRK